MEIYRTTPFSIAKFYDFKRTRQEWPKIGIAHKVQNSFFAFFLAFWRKIYSNLIVVPFFSKNDGLYEGVMLSNKKTWSEGANTFYLNACICWSTFWDSFSVFFLREIFLVVLLYVICEAFGAFYNSRWCYQPSREKKHCTQYEIFRQKT